MRLTMLRTLCLPLALCLGVMAAPASAVDFNWNVAGPADWADGANWDPEGPPAGGGGNAAFVNNGGTAEISADIADIQDIFVGVGVDTSGTLNQSGGATFGGTVSWMFVGQDGGTGTYNLSGGTANKARLYVGRGAGGVGTLNVSGTGVVGGEFFIAGEGGGAATVSVTDSGSVATTGNIELQNAAVTISGDALVKSGNEVWFGNGGGNSTTADIDSGTVESDTWLVVGRDGASGVVNLSGDAVLRKVSVPGNVDSEGAFMAVGTIGSGTGTLNVSENATVWSDTGMTVGENDGAGVVNQSGGSVTLHDYTPREFQAQLGSSLELDPNGTAMGAYNLSGGVLTAETIEVGGGLFSMTGGTLTATNFIGDLTQGGGVISPGASPGIMLVTGNYSLLSGDLFMEIEGTGAGTGYDQLIVTGDVSLAGDLTLAGAFVPLSGDAFTLIDNQGPNAIAGGFTGIAEGSIVNFNGVDLTATYLGGDGNDFVLFNAIPEPTSLALLLGLGGAALAARRR